VIPKRRVAEKAPLSFCAQPIIATFRAVGAERKSPKSFIATGK
jgi:hypothetical protein